MVLVGSWNESSFKKNLNNPLVVKLCELFLLQHDVVKKERTGPVRLRVSSSKPASEQV